MEKFLEGNIFLKIKNLIEGCAVSECGEMQKNNC